MERDRQMSFLVSVAVVLGIVELGYSGWRLMTLWPIQVLASSTWIVLRSRFAAFGADPAGWALLGILMVVLLAPRAPRRKDPSPVSRRVSRGGNHE